MGLTKDDIPDYAPETIEHNGWTIRIEVPYDEHMGPPWEEHDGHGIVSEWTRRAKAPGEMVLAEDHGSYRYYDFAESVKLARKDGWGPSDKDSGKTPGERAHLAALEDYRRLKAWCNDQWTWVGVVVTATAPDGAQSQDSLWGIESDGDYWRDIAAELANSLMG